MAKLITVYWRDIPSQIVVKHKRETFKLKLSRRFQQAIDRAAMRAGKGGSEYYMNDWRRVSSTCSADVETEARAAVDALEAKFSDEDLVALVRSKGLATKDADATGV